MAAWQVLWRGRSRWTVLIAACWVEATAGLSYVFSTYSPALKSELSYDQRHINRLSVAKDLGDTVGLAAGFLCRILPSWAVLLLGAALILAGYGSLWLLTDHLIPAVPFWSCAHLEQKDGEQTICRFLQAVKFMNLLFFETLISRCGNKVREEYGHIQSVQESAETLKSDSVEIALGWPISAFSSFSQECAYWWPWLYSSAASRYNVLPASAPLMFVHTGAHVEPCHSSSSSSLQGNHGSAVTNPLAKFEQVPNVISASVCDSQNLEVPQHLLDQGTTAGNACISGHSNFHPGVCH